MTRGSEGMRYVMATLLHVKILATAHDAAAQACEKAFRMVERLEGLLSVFRPESELSRINACAGQAPARVSQDTFEAVRQALELAAHTRGAYDPTIGAVTRTDSSTRTPACDLIDFRAVQLDAESGRVFLPKRGMKLDLGGAGKGFALDQALEAVQSEPEVTQVRFNFGGQLVFWNRNDSLRERVFIEMPSRSKWEAPSFLMTRNGSVSTSSPAERGSHIFDPRTGRPAPDRPGVTVVATTAAAADAWSTALYVLGPEAGPELARTQEGLEVL